MGGGGGGGGGPVFESEFPASRNNLESSDHLPPQTWSKILLRNRASCTQNPTRLCILMRPILEDRPEYILYTAVLHPHQIATMLEGEGGGDLFQFFPHLDLLQVPTLFLAHTGRWGWGGGGGGACCRGNKACSIYWNNNSHVCMCVTLKTAFTFTLVLPDCAVVHHHGGRPSHGPDDHAHLQRGNCVQ